MVAQVAPSSFIKSLHAREILDSRGKPTIEVDLLTEDGTRRMRTK